jgi:hypothetical protein
MSRAVHGIGIGLRKVTRSRVPRKRRARHFGVEGLETRSLLTTMIGLTSSNSLLLFDSATPATIQNTIPITGLPSGESIVSITDRPATGGLLALGNNSHLYSIKLGTGAATALSTTSFTPTIVGSRFGISTNAVTDTVRLVDDAGQNLRLSPTSGAVLQSDTMLGYAAGDPNVSTAPDLVSLAYTNSVPGASTTTAYGIDAGITALVRLGSPGGSPTSPSSGQLFTVGLLGVNITDTVGFDIVGSTNTAYAALSVPGQGTALYTINLNSGTASKVGAIGAGNTPLIGLAASIPTTPPAPTLAPSSDSGVSQTDHITNIANPVIQGTALANASILVTANGVIVGQGNADSAGNYAIPIGNIQPNNSLAPLADGTYTVTVVQTDGSGVFSSASTPLSPNLVIKTSAPAPGVPTLFSSIDTGFSNTDHYTRFNTPQFFGAGELNDTVQLFANGQLIATGPVQFVGQYALQASTLSDGAYQITANQIDVAGNTSPMSAAMKPQLVIDTSGRPTPAQAYVNQVYSDLLGHPADQAAFDKWSPIVVQPNGRSVFVSAVLGSVEYRQNVVRTVYQTLLHRAPEPSALTIGANYLTTHTDEQLRSVIAGSGEYYALHGGTNLSFLTALYPDLLHRPIDPAGQSKYLAFLNGGGSPQNAVLIILQSQEGFAATATTIYQTLLRRSPDSVSLANMVNILNSGGRDEDLISILATSPEYYKNAHGTDQVINQWGSQAYLDILGRPADPTGVAALVSLVNSGASTVKGIQALQAGDEYRATQVNQAYQTVLRRAPESASLTQGITYLASGGTLQKLEATLYGSQEYYIRFGGGTNAGYLAAVYNDILGRPIDSGANAAGLQALNYGSSRAGIALSLFTSAEGTQRTIQQIYGTYLRRVATFAELTALSTNINNGTLSYNDLIASLVGSQEYFSGL